MLNYSAKLPLFQCGPEKETQKVFYETHAPVRQFASFHSKANKIQMSCIVQLFYRYFSLVVASEHRKEEKLTSSRFGFNARKREFAQKIKLEVEIFMCKCLDCSGIGYTKIFAFFLSLFARLVGSFR
jgi:hypothetical protein